MGEPSRFGRYEVKRVLGEGQMGVVYLAKDPLIGRPVAIKVIREDPGMLSGGFAECRARFEREIRVAGTFSHPNIVTIYDVGLDKAASFVAMEYVDGGSLAHLMVKEPTLSFDRVTDLVTQIASALDYAHERGVVHRDVKPANILLTMNGVPKVTDFGVARLADSTMTLHGSTYGSPAYMSPEQAASQVIDGTSDQFSLAIVTYRMLTGELPFAGESITAVIYRVLKQDPVPPELLNPLLPERAGEVLLRSLSKHPKDRYPDCSTMAEDLREALEAASFGEQGASAQSSRSTAAEVGDSSVSDLAEGGARPAGQPLAGSETLEGSANVDGSSRLFAWTATLSKSHESRVWSALTAAVVVLVAAVAGANWLLGGGDQLDPGVPPASEGQPARAEGSVLVPWKVRELRSESMSDRGGAAPEGQAGQPGGGLSGREIDPRGPESTAREPAARPAPPTRPATNGGTPLYRLQGSRPGTERGAGETEQEGAGATQQAADDAETPTPATGEPAASQASGEEPGGLTEAGEGAPPLAAADRSGELDSTSSAEAARPSFESRWVLTGEGDVPEELAERAINSANVLETMVNDEEDHIPTSILNEASCVAVIPGMKKVGFLVGARHGKGLMTCRSPRGWSRPSFVSITGGSMGLQIGAQSTDIVLVFTDPAIAERFAEDSLPLGGSGVSLSAGPVGKTAESSRDVEAESAVYSYARARGLFAGVSLEGTTMKVDEAANRITYGEDVDLLDLLLTFEGTLPPELAGFLRCVESYES